MAAHEWVGVPSGKSGALNRSPFKSPQPKERGALGFFWIGRARDGVRGRARAGEGGHVHVSDATWVGGKRTYAACRTNACASDP